MAAALRGDLAHLEHFCTLSPLPGFAKWLNAALSAAAAAPAVTALTSPAVTAPAAAGNGSSGGALLLSSTDAALAVQCLAERGERRRLGSCDAGAAEHSYSYFASASDDGADGSAGAPRVARGARTSGSVSATEGAGCAALQQLLAPGEGWFSDPLICDRLRPLLRQLAARYVAEAKQTPSRGRHGPSFALVGGG